MKVVSTLWKGIAVQTLFFFKFLQFISFAVHLQTCTHVHAHSDRFERLFSTRTDFEILVLCILLSNIPIEPISDVCFAIYLELFFFKEKYLRQIDTNRIESNRIGFLARKFIWFNIAILVHQFREMIVLRWINRS